MDSASDVVVLCLVDFSANVTTDKSLGTYVSLPRAESLSCSCGKPSQHSRLQSLVSRRRRLLLPRDAAHGLVDSRTDRSLPCHPF